MDIKRCEIKAVNEVCERASVVPSLEWGSRLEQVSFCFQETSEKAVRLNTVLMLRLDIRQVRFCKHCLWTS